MIDAEWLAVLPRQWDASGLNEWRFRASVTTVSAASDASVERLKEFVHVCFGQRVQGTLTQDRICQMALELL